MSKFKIGDRVRVRSYENLGVDGFVVLVEGHASTKRFRYDVELVRKKYIWEEERYLDYTERQTFMGLELVQLGKIGDVVEIVDDVFPGGKMNGTIDNMNYNNYFDSWYYGFVLEKEYVTDGKYCHSEKTIEGEYRSNTWAMYEIDYWKKYLDVSKIK